MLHFFEYHLNNIGKVGNFDSMQLNFIPRCRHGFGTLSYRLQNGTFRLGYRGDWSANKPEGVGWRYYENGNVYFGFWKSGRRHGYGTMWYKEGTMYVGYWNMNKREGLGMFVQGILILLI